MPIEKLTPENCYFVQQKFEAGRRAREKRIAARLLKECQALGYDDQRQDGQWRNEIAHDLNVLIGRADYFLAQDGDESDIEAAKATLRIVKRVAEFEGIRRAK